MFLLVNSSAVMIASRPIWTPSCALVLPGVPPTSSSKPLPSKHYPLFSNSVAAAPSSLLRSAVFLVWFYWNFWISNFLKSASLPILFAPAPSSTRSPTSNFYPTPSPLLLIERLSFYPSTWFDCSLIMATLLPASSSYYYLEVTLASSKTSGLLFIKVWIAIVRSDMAWSFLSRAASREFIWAWCMVVIERRLSICEFKRAVLCSYSSFSFSNSFALYYSSCILYETTCSSLSQVLLIYYESPDFELFKIWFCTSGSNISRLFASYFSIWIAFLMWAVFLLFICTSFALSASVTSLAYYYPTFPQMASISSNGNDWFNFWRVPSSLTVSKLKCLSSSYLMIYIAACIFCGLIYSKTPEASVLLST